MSEDIRQHEGGIKFLGKAPPQFHEAIKSVKNENENKAEEAKLARQKDPFAEEIKPQGKMRAVGSPQLEELLQQLRPKTFAYDKVMLPSKGVFYSGEDGPTDGVLNIRPMTGEEEQILATPRYMKRGTGINMIFQRCVKEQIKPDDLLSVDRTYILIALRNISYGHEYDVEIKCPNCEKKFNCTLRLDQLLVNYCPSDFQPPLVDVLPNSGLKFGWRLPRGKDENVVTDYREKRAKEYRDAAVDDSLLFRIAMMLENVEGVKEKQELMILLKKLPIQDVSYLRSIAMDPPFGVDTKCDITCDLCYHDFDVELPLEAGFFFPRHKKKVVKKTDTDSGDI